MGWYDPIIAWFSKHIPWRYIFGIFVVSGILLFLSRRLGIYGWEHPYRPWLIVAFIFSGAVLLSYLGSGIYPWLADHVRDTRMMSLGQKHLHRLNPEEKIICKKFLDTNGSVQMHSPAEGAFQLLLLKCILVQPTHAWPHGLCDYNIQPWALEYLKKHPNCWSSMMASERVDMI